MTEHTYPPAYQPGSHWSLDETWNILDTLKPGTLSENERFFIADMIAAALMTAYRRGKQEADDIAIEVVNLMRKAAKDGLGFNCTFVDDDMRVIVGLAQRAVLAGLDADAQSDMRQRFREAAEKVRAEHEKALGFPIKRQIGGEE